MKHDPSLNPHNHPYVLFQTGKDKNGKEETTQNFYATLKEAVWWRDSWALLGYYDFQRIENINNEGVELGIVTRPVGSPW